VFTTDEGESSKDEQSEDDFEDVPEDELQEEFSEQEAESNESVSPKKNWWDDYGSDSE
jgi:hypothetical protein